MAKYYRKAESEAMLYKADGSNADEVIEWARGLGLWADPRPLSTIIDIARIMRITRVMYRDVPTIGECMVLEPGHWFVLTECRSFQIWREDQFDRHYISVKESNG